MARREALAYASTPFPIRAPHFVMWTLSQLETLLSPERIAAGDPRVTTTLDLDWQAGGGADCDPPPGAVAALCAVTDALPGVTCDAEADPARRAENAALVALDPHDRRNCCNGRQPGLLRPGHQRRAQRQRSACASPAPPSSRSPTRPRSTRPAPRAGRAPWTAATLGRGPAHRVHGGRGHALRAEQLRPDAITARSPCARPSRTRTTSRPSRRWTSSASRSWSTWPLAWAFRGSGAAHRRAARLSLHLTAEAGQWTASGETPRYGLSLTLGGGEVTLLDLTAAYAAFANGGFRSSRYAIARVDHAGRAGGLHPCRTRRGPTRPFGHRPARRLSHHRHPERRPCAAARVRHGQRAPARPARGGQDRHDDRLAR
jgi:hypothetical protein